MRCAGIHLAIYFLLTYGYISFKFIQQILRQLRLHRHDEYNPIGTGLPNTIIVYLLLGDTWCKKDSLQQENENVHFTSNVLFCICYFCCCCCCSTKLLPPFQISNEQHLVKDKKTVKLSVLSFVAYCSFTHST